MKPGTAIDAVFPFAEKVDQVLVMTVEPGLFLFMQDLEDKSLWRT